MTKRLLIAIVCEIDSNKQNLKFSLFDTTVKFSTGKY